MKKLKVSHHAVVRYIQRRPDWRAIRDALWAELGEAAEDRDVIEALEMTREGRFAIWEIKKILAGPKVNKIWRALGDGYFPVRGGGRVRVCEGVVVTYYEPASS